MAARQLACNLARASNLRFAVSSPHCGLLNLAPAFLRAFATVKPDLKYADSHEWVQEKGDGVVRVGISDHAQGQLGEVVYVELPEVGKSVSKGEPFGVVESVKAASDINSPVSGEVTSVNEDLSGNESKVNDDPFGEGWMMEVKVSDSGDLDGLMDSEAYSKKCEEEAH